MPGAFKEGMRSPGQAALIAEHLLQHAATLPAIRQRTGKLVAVTAMPGHLDKWISDDLRAWGKYKVTGDPEGASLVIEAQLPEKPVEYPMPPGMPQPGRRSGRVRVPGT